MKRQPAARPPQEPSPPEDIEIIEIVGLDESTPAPAADADEVVVTFDEEPQPAPRATPAASRRDRDAEERLLRLRADFENLKKRIERERDDYYRHATAALVCRLLPVLDNFERAMASLRQNRSQDPLLEGLALIHRQLLEELRREGLRPVESLGCPFNPALHEAVATVANSGLPANTVVDELQRGYHFEDRLLRPALVRVSVNAESEDDPRSDREDS